MAKRTSMRTIAVRNIVSHKLRLALTVLSVMLGTAFISGAFMFTNSLSSTFEAAVGSAYEDVDAAVGPAEGLPIIDGETVQAITDDESVRAVNLTESTNVVVANENLEAYQVGGGTSTLQMYYPPEDKVGTLTRSLTAQHRTVKARSSSTIPLQKSKASASARRSFWSLQKSATKSPSAESTPQPWNKDWVRCRC